MERIRSFVQRHPLGVYFAIAYGISLVALSVIGLPRLDGRGSAQSASFVMFPVLVIGVGVTGVVMTALIGGRDALRDLGRRWRRVRLGRWWLALAIPPLGIVTVLTSMHFLVAPVFASQPALGFTAFGVAIGVVSGFFEEWGWTGFAYPVLSARFGALTGAILLGVLWGIWHFPVVDSLGAASPHGAYLPAFFAAFIAVVTAIRALIGWVYTNTQSVLAAQLLHASSTGSLVVLSAPHVSPGQEASWYFVYAGLLWLVVGGVWITSAARSRPETSATVATGA